MKIVYIDGSMSAFTSRTRFRGTCSAKVMTKLTQVYPDAEIVYRDLAADPLPHLRAHTLPAIFGQAESED